MFLFVAESNRQICLILAAWTGHKKHILNSNPKNPRSYSSALWDQLELKIGCRFRFHSFEFVFECSRSTFIQFDSAQFSLGIFGVLLC